MAKHKRRRRRAPRPQPTGWVSPYLLPGTVQGWLPGAAGAPLSPQEFGGAPEGGGEGAGAPAAS
jgi:hypothetical protein